MELIEKLKQIFQVPFVDFIGVVHDKIERVAIVAGASDKVEVIQEAESLGAQAIISGEVDARVRIHTVERSTRK